jgi:hypothetical protein
VVEAQLRIYTIKPGCMDDFVSEWRRGIAPLRERFGFRILGPRVDEETRTFAWVLEYEDNDGFNAAASRYYDSPERRALTPGRHLEVTDTRMLRRVSRGDSPG